MRFNLETFSFVIGFITATVFWWLMGRMRPLWAEIRENWKTSREEAQARRSTGVRTRPRTSRFNTNARSCISMRSQRLSLLCI